MISTADITGVILAGGRASRMGGEDKGLIPLAGRPLIEHILERLQAQVGTVLISANRNIAQYTAYGPVVTDSIDDYAGPLAGMLAAMEAVDTPYILTVPCDGPYLPKDLGQRLQDALQETKASIAVVHDGQRLQPVYALIDRGLTGSLRDYLNQGNRKIDHWFVQHPMVTVTFPKEDKLFININRPEELRLVATQLHETSP